MLSYEVLHVGVCVYLYMLQMTKSTIFSRTLAPM